MDFGKWAIRVVCMLAVIYIFSLVGAINFPFTLSAISNSPGQFLLSLISVIVVAIIAFLLGRGVRSVKGSLEAIGLAYLSALIIGGLLALLEQLRFPAAVQINLAWLGTTWYDPWITVFIFGAPIMLAFLI